jgi:hypothetical protein
MMSLEPASTQKPVIVTGRSPRFGVIRVKAMAGITRTASTWNSAVEAVAIAGPVEQASKRTMRSNSENSKANRIETMKGPAESGQICSVGRRKIAKKIAKNKRCYANTMRPRSRMLLKAMKGG